MTLFFSPKHKVWFWTGEPTCEICGVTCKQNLVHRFTQGQVKTYTRLCFLCSKRTTSLDAYQENKLAILAAPAALPDDAFPVSLNASPLVAGRQDAPLEGVTIDRTRYADSMPSLEGASIGKQIDDRSYINDQEVELEALTKFFRAALPVLPADEKKQLEDKQ